MTYHSEHPWRDIEKPLKSANMQEVVGKWDADFVDEADQEMLFELILVCAFSVLLPLFSSNSTWLI